MQNLKLPQIPVHEVFYLRQLTVSVFRTHNLKDNTASFILTTMKGTEQKVQMKYVHFFRATLKKIYLAIKLHIFSDECWAQNKKYK